MQHVPTHLCFAQNHQSGYLIVTPHMLEFFEI